MKSARIIVGVFFIAAVQTGCGGATEKTPAAQDQVVTAPAPPQDTTEIPSVGSVAFSLNGQTKRFEYLPEADNNYTPLASTVRAMPSSGSGEQLAITFLSMDLKTQAYPADLPLPRGAAGASPLVAMSNVGFSYTNENRQEWAGPGRVTVESFSNDGVIVGTFSDVSIPHTDAALPNVTLSDGTFRARISPPW